MRIEVNRTCNSSLLEGDVVRIRLEDHIDVRISGVLALQQASHLNFLVLLEDFDSLIGINLPLEDRGANTIQVLIGEISDGTNLISGIRDGSPLALHQNILLSLIGILRRSLLIERTCIAVLIEIVLLEVLTREGLGQSLVLHQVVLSLNPSGLAAISGLTSAEAVVILDVLPLVGRSVFNGHTSWWWRKLTCSLRNTYGDVTIVEDVSCGLLNQRYAHEGHTVDGCTALLSTISLCLTSLLLRHLRTEGNTIFRIDGSLSRLRGNVGTNDELGEFELVLKTIVSEFLRAEFLVIATNGGVVYFNELA